MVLTLAGLSHYGIGSAVIVASISGFVIVFLFAYMSVLARTHEIGILRALGASTSYILRILVLDAILLATVGVVAGIAMAALMQSLFPTVITGIDKIWLAGAALVTVAGFLIGAISSGLRAAREDVIRAIDYD